MTPELPRRRAKGCQERSSHRVLAANSRRARDLRQSLLRLLASQLDETVQLISAAGGSARAWVADVTDEPQVRQTMREIGQQMGSIDVLVNNAGASSTKD